MDRKRGNPRKREQDTMKKNKLTKSEIIKAFRLWFMPNYYDISMFDYTTLNDEQIYQCYLDECENYGKEEIDNELKEHLK